MLTDISHIYDRIIKEAVNRAYEAGYKRGYNAGRLGLPAKEEEEDAARAAQEPSNE